MTRLAVDMGAAWRPYWGGGPLPAGAQALGTVTRGDDPPQALLVIRGVYWCGRAGAVRGLPQNVVREAIEARRMGYAHLKRLAERAFAECVELAQTSKPGCAQACKALKSAAKHGLHDRPYIVRGDTLVGWGGVAGGYRIEPLRGVHRGGARAGGGVKAADGAQNLIRKNVTLDQASIDALRVLGGGDLSLGIRRAAARR